MALLASHIAVVTGAGSGIGRAIAAGYAREGAQVVLLDVNADTVAEAAEEIRNAGGKAESFALDVTRRDDCFALAKQVAEKVGQVSILVNNAGITRRNAFTAETETVAKDWDDIISLNLNASSTPRRPSSPRCAQAKAASSISARSNPSCICARRARRPTPRPSTACSASPGRWRSS